MPPRRGTVAVSQPLSPDDLTYEQADELLGQFYNANKPFPVQKALWLCKADVPACRGLCPKNDKTNPGCLCGWVPARNSYKKKGLWQKEPTALSMLGPDPNEYRREVRPPLCRWCGSRRGPCSACCAPTHALTTQMTISVDHASRTLGCHAG